MQNTVPGASTRVISFNLQTTSGNAIISILQVGKPRPHTHVLTTDTQLTRGRLGFEFQSTDFMGAILSSLLLWERKKRKALSANTIIPLPFAPQEGLEACVYHIQVCPFPAKSHPALTKCSA